MTATTVAAVVQRTRRFIRDWLDQDTISGSLTSTTTSVAVADSSIYTQNWMIQLDTEAMIVRAIADATHLTVSRGAFGTTAATHAASTPVLLNPAFTDLDILDGLNGGISACFPLIYKEVVDESTTLVGGTTYEYTIPAALQFLTELAVEGSGDVRFRPIRSWDVMRGATPTVRLRRAYGPGTLRMRGYGPFDRLALGGSLDALWPVRAEEPLVFFAAQYLGASGELGRVRFGRGLNDQREQANRVGSSMTAANSVYTRFERARDAAAMPPMPRRTVSVL